MEIKASTFFSKDQQLLIRDAIKQAEGETSGEIRVHIETSLSGNVLDRAAWIFRHIKMHETDDRNGVLFYLAVRNKKFAVIGDGGINSRVPEGFWDTVKDTIESHFREGEYCEGIIEGVLLAGRQLRDHFPHERDDVNELPDEISFEDNEQAEKQ